MGRAPWYLLAAAPVLAGTLYARQQAFPVRWGALALILVAALLGAEAALAARASRIHAGACVTLSIVLACALVPLSGAAILGLAILAVAFASVWVAPFPRDLAGLGELAAFLVTGPLLVSAGYFAQSSELSVGALLASLPLGLLTAAAGFPAHFTHAPGERDPMCPILVAGPAQARQILWALPVLAFLAIVLNVRFLEYPPASLAALAAAVPFAWKLRSVREGIPADELRRTTHLLLVLAVAADVLIVAGFFGSSPRQL
jgi:1,4-dihydroxy-2-naphthoate octaprenyltransferase